MRRSYAGACSLLSLVTACVSAHMSRTYVLGAARDSPADLVPAPNAARIQLDPIVIPDYLDTTDILLRHGAYELVASSTARWGERLSTALRDALASDLSARLPRDLITTTHDPDPSARRLRLTVSAFDVWANGRCILNASWSIAEKGVDPRNPTEATLLLPSGAEAGSGSDSLVVGSMAAVVAMLADRIAASIDAIDEPITGLR